MAISSISPDAFLATHAVFARSELEAALPRRAPATVTSHLERWRRQGRIEAVKRGLFVRIDEPGARTPPDFAALAARMAPDAALAYHTALEVHGFAQSAFERLTFVTWTNARAVTWLGRRLVPVRPRAPLLAAGRGERWIERVDRSGLPCRVTTLERTVADVLDRPGLAGGIEEVWRSLQAVRALDTSALEEYVDRLHSKTLAAKVGYFLESRREELVVSEALLARLRRRRPAGPSFIDRRRKGRLVSQWGLIVPVDLFDHEAGVSE